MDHSRTKKLLNWFENSPLDSITPQEIERRFSGRLPDLSDVEPLPRATFTQPQRIGLRIVAERRG